MTDDPAIPEPDLTFAFQLDVDVGPIQDIGMIDGLHRRIFPIVGGVVHGPRLSGVVMPGGADWQGVRPGDGLTRLMAHYWLRTDDGQIVSVQNTGLRRMPPGMMDSILRGAIVPPDSYYFRANPVFEAPDGPHRWLNETLFVCVGARMPDHIAIRVYAVD